LDQLFGCGQERLHTGLAFGELGDAPFMGLVGCGDVVRSEVAAADGAFCVGAVKLSDSTACSGQLRADQSELGAVVIGGAGTGGLSVDESAAEACWVGRTAVGFDGWTADCRRELLLVLACTGQARSARGYICGGQQWLGCNSEFFKQMPVSFGLQACCMG
jgi:hypothetical protein